MKKKTVMILIFYLAFVLIFSSCKSGGDNQQAVSDEVSSAFESSVSVLNNDSNTASPASASQSDDNKTASSTVDSSKPNSQPSGNQTSSSKAPGTSSEPGKNNNSNSNNSSNNNSSNNSGDTSSVTEISNKPVYLTVIDCVLTDKNRFVIVGKCEEGASVTAKTGSQTVTAGSDKGYYSVRLEKESTYTRVTLEAKGSITDKYVYDANPKVPTRDMWPIVGGNGYNFFFQKMMPDFMHTNTLSGSQLDSLTQKTKNRIASLKNFLPDTKIIYMVVPSKATVYPELVPKEYTQETGKSKLQQVNEALEAGGAKVINLPDVFAKHKNDQYKLYWNTDSHWTDYGAYIAYNELFNYIGTSFPAAAPRKQQEFDFKCSLYKSGDMMLYMMINQSAAKEYNCLRVPKFSMNSSITSVNRYRAVDDLIYSDAVVQQNFISNNSPNLPDLYVIRDSYSTQMYDILAERSNTTLYKPMWNYTYNISEIKRTSPDFIIYLIAEWNLDSIIYS